jgi:hypothetical protein
VPIPVGIPRPTSTNLGRDGQMDRQGSAHWSAYTSAYRNPADLCLWGGLNAVYTRTHDTGGTFCRRGISNPSHRSRRTTSPFAPVIALDGPPEFNKVFSDQTSKQRTLGDSDFPLAGKSVHESPVRDGTCRVWLAGSRGVPGVSFKWTRCCCWLSIMLGQPPQWCHGTVFDLKQHMYGDVTYSGHSLTFVSQQPRLIPPTTTTQLGKLDLAGSGFRVLLAPYSGAITYCTPTSIVIQYFN